MVKSFKTKIKPKNGRIVIDPLTKKAIPEKGLRVVLTAYWQKRISDGDVEIVTRKSPKKKEA